MGASALEAPVAGTAPEEEVEESMMADFDKKKLGMRKWTVRWLPDDGTEWLTQLLGGSSFQA